MREGERRGKGEREREREREGEGEYRLCKTNRVTNAINMITCAVYVNECVHISCVRIITSSSYLFALNYNHIIVLF